MNQVDVPRYDDDAIAIIGIACRFPGSSTPEQLWRNLSAGIDSATELSDADLAAPGVAAEASDPGYVRRAYVLDDIEGFDAELFGFTERAAALTDPQHRVFLECVWSALEDAGYDPSSISALTGVYAGASSSSYYLENVRQRVGHRTSVDGFLAHISNDKDYVATLVSHRLNLKGPSVSVQSACSSSLLAVHLACQSLRMRECDLAIAGGVSVRVPQRAGYVHQPEGLFSASGRCRSFDASADGVAFGSGAGAVVLKRLGEALRDRDRVDAVVLGSATGNDGRNKLGYAASSVEAQVRIMSEALAVAGVKPDELAYVEAHGSGTRLGDAVEYTALRQVLEHGAARKGPCRVGSIKSNLGHLECASGVAGLIKAALLLRERSIPASSHFQSLTSEADGAGSPIEINRDVVDLSASEAPLFASVNSLGMGGTNVHVVLGSPPPSSLDLGASARSSAQLLVLSAASMPALRALCTACRSALSETRGELVYDFCATLARRRRHHPVRLAVVGRSRDELGAALDAWLAGTPHPLVRSSVSAAPAPPVVGAEREEATQSSRVQELVSLCQAYVGGQVPDWRVAFASPFACLRLPTYPFQRRRCWLEPTPTPARDIAANTKDSYPRTGFAWRRVDVALPEVVAVYTGELDCERFPFLLDHRINGRIVLPGMAFLEMVTVNAADALGSSALELGDIRLERPLELGRTASVELQVVLLASETSALRFQVASRGSATGDWTIHVRGRVIALRSEDVPGADPELERIRTRCSEAPRLQDFYERFEASGIAWGPTFRGLHALAVSDAEAFAEIRPPAMVCEEVARYTFHPALADACGQALFGALGVDTTGSGAFVSRAARRVRIYAPARGARLFCHVQIRDRKQFEGDLRVFDEHGTVVADLDGITLAPLRVASSQSSLDRSLYVTEWRATAPIHTPVTPEGEEAGVVALLVEDSELQGALATEIARHGRRVIVATRGRRFERYGAREFVVDPSSAEDVRHLLEAAAELYGRCDALVIAWKQSDSTPEFAEREQQRYCTELLAAVRGLEGVKGTRLWVMTRGVHDPLSAHDARMLEPALLWGLGKTLSVERAAAWGGLVDVPQATGAVQTASDLALEICNPDGENFVAYRHGVRCAERLVRSTAVAEPATELSLRADAAYVISGGFGALGGAVARRLVARGAKELVLIGRSGQGPALVAELEAMGARVHSVAASISDQTELHRVFARLRAHGLGAVRGVVHAAGVIESQALSSASGEDVLRLVEPKLLGALALEKALAHEPLDFFVAFSSAASVLSSPALGAYAAANAALDAFARYRQARGLPALAVNWGPWANLGMNTQNGHARAVPEGWTAIELEDGLGLLERLIVCAVPQIAVLPVDFALWQARYSAYSHAPLLALLGDASVRELPTDEGIRARVLTAAPQAREALLVKHLEQWLGFRLQPPGVAMPAGIDLAELGFDSLTALEIKAHIEDALGVTLSVENYLGSRTVQQIAGAVVARLGEPEPRAVISLIERIEQLSDDQAEALLARSR